MVVTLDAGAGHVGVGQRRGVHVLGLRRRHQVVGRVLERLRLELVLLRLLAGEKDPQFGDANQRGGFPPQCVGVTGG